MIQPLEFIINKQYFVNHYFMIFEKSNIRGFIFVCFFSVVQQRNFKVLIIRSSWKEAESLFIPIPHATRASFFDSFWQRIWRWLKTSGIKLWHALKEILHHLYMLSSMDHHLTSGCSRMSGITIHYQQPSPTTSIQKSQQ